MEQFLCITLRQTSWKQIIQLFMMTLWSRVFFVQHFRCSTNFTSEVRGHFIVHCVCFSSKQRWLPLPPLSFLSSSSSSLPWRRDLPIQETTDRSVETFIITVRVFLFPPSSSVSHHQILLISIILAFSRRFGSRRSDSSDLIN